MPSSFERKIESMYGILRAVALASPVAIGALVALNALSASRPLALGGMSLVVAATALAAAIIEDRHAGIGAR
jgi:hypothetical protein